jgi:hypothetical protein
VNYVTEYSPQSAALSRAMLIFVYTCCDSLSMLPTFQRKSCWLVALIHSCL